MIEKGLVEWLIMFLTTNHDRVYSLEYSTALFMNLCLHADARERCPTAVLKLLTDLLNTQHTQVSHSYPQYQPDILSTLNYLKDN